MMINQTTEKVHTDIFESDAAKVSNPTLSSIMTTVKKEAINQLGLQNLVDDVSKDVKKNYRRSVVQRAVLPGLVSSTPFPKLSDVKDSKESFYGSPILSNSLDQSAISKKSDTEERHERVFHENNRTSIKSPNILTENLPPPSEKFHPDDPSDMDIEEPSPSGIHDCKTPESNHVNDGRRLTSHFILGNNSKENLPEVRSYANTRCSKIMTNAKSISYKQSLANKKQTLTTDAERFKKVIDSGPMSESENRLSEKRKREIVNSKDYRIPEYLNNSSTSSNNSTFRTDVKRGRSLKNWPSSAFERRSELIVERKKRKNYSEAIPLENFRMSKIRRSKSVPRKNMRYEIIDYNNENKKNKKYYDHYQYVDVISDGSDVSQEVRIRRPRNIYKSPKRTYLLRVRSSSGSEDVEDRFKKRKYSSSSSPHQELVGEGRKSRISKRYIYNNMIRGRRREKEKNKYRLISNYADMEEDDLVPNQENELVSYHHDKVKTYNKTQVIHQNTDKQDCDMLDERSKKMQENNKNQNMDASLSDVSNISHVTDPSEGDVRYLDAALEVIGHQDEKRKEYLMSREVLKKRARNPFEIRGESQQQSSQHSRVSKIEHVLKKLSKNYNKIGEGMNSEVQSPPNDTNDQQNSPGKLLGNPISNKLANRTGNLKDIVVLQNITIQKKKESIIADETQQEIHVELVSNNTTNEKDIVKKDVFAKPIRPPRRKKAHSSNAELNIEDSYAGEYHTDPGIQPEKRERSMTKFKKSNSNPELGDSSTCARKSSRQKNKVLPFWQHSGSMSAEIETRNASKKLHLIKGKKNSRERLTRATTKKILDQKNICETATKMTGPVITSNKKESTEDEEKFTSQQTYSEGKKNSRERLTRATTKNILDQKNNCETATKMTGPVTTSNKKESTEDEEKFTSQQTYSEGEGILSTDSLTPIDHLNRKETTMKNTKTKRIRRKNKRLNPPPSTQKRKKTSVLSSKSKQNTKGSSIASLEIEQTGGSSSRMDAHEVDVQVPIQIDNDDVDDFAEFVDDNHKDGLETLPKEKATSERKRRCTESSDSPEMKKNKQSALKDQAAHKDKRNSPESLEKCSEKFYNLLNEVRGACSLTKSSGFLSLAPAEFHHLFNSEYAQRYTRLQGTNSLKIGAHQIEKSPDVFVIPKGVTAEIENTGSEHAVFFIHYIGSPGN